MITILIKGEPQEVETFEVAWEKIRKNRRGYKLHALMN